MHEHEINLNFAFKIFNIKDTKVLIVDQFWEDFSSEFWRKINKNSEIVFKLVFILGKSVKIIYKSKIFKLSLNYLQKIFKLQEKSTKSLKIPSKMNSLILAILISTICLSLSIANPTEKLDAAQTTPGTIKKPTLKERLEKAQSENQKSNQSLKSIQDDFKLRHEKFEKALKAQEDAFEELFAPMHHGHAKVHKRSPVDDDTSSYSDSSEPQTEDDVPGWLFGWIFKRGN